MTERKKNPKTFKECNTGNCMECLHYSKQHRPPECKTRKRLIKKEGMVWENSRGWIKKEVIA